MPPAGFEPAAPGLGILCSILLSYGGKTTSNIILYSGVVKENFPGPRIFRQYADLYILSQLYHHRRPAERHDKVVTIIREASLHRGLPDSRDKDKAYV